MMRRRLRGLTFFATCALSTACATSAARAPTVTSLSTDGQYRVATYTDLPHVPEFAAATVYYPVGAEGPIGGVAIAPGFTEQQRHISWWGPRLASHGYAVLTLDTNDPRDQPQARADALTAAVRLLQGENERTGSPLFGRIDVKKMAIMGHSMGGGGALLAANEHGDLIRAVIPFAPWEPDTEFNRITVPTLIIAGSADPIAPVSEHAWRHFNSIPRTTTKAYVEFDGMDHFLADTERGKDLATVGRYALAWLKLYMDGDESYRDLIYGARPSEDDGKFSRFVTNP
jgi:alpha-beta hydrolase superfamily lysophospholipase